jgi:signal transduction histidine kinase
MAIRSNPPPTRDFGLVASRISRLLILVAEANGVPEKTMRSTAHLTASMDEIMAPSSVIRWSDLVILADRVAAHFNSNPALVEVGRNYYQHLEHLPYIKAASSILTLRGAFYLSNRFTAPSNYEALICTAQWLNHNEALKTNRLKYERDPMSAPIAYISKGILEYFPTLFGRDPLPFVEMELEERGCRFHIKLPPPLRPWFFIKRMVQSLKPDHQRWEFLRDQEALLRESQWQASQQSQIAAQALTHAREQERQVLARDLHDGLGQTLSGLSYRVAALCLTQPNNADLTALDRGIRSALAQARDLAHRTLPADEDEPIARFRDTCTSYSNLTNIPVHFAVTGGPVLLDSIQIDELDFILREALANAARHSHASQLQVLATVSPDEFTLEVSDNGIGIHPHQPDGFGIQSMKARAISLAASIVWHNLSPGTCVRCCLPLSAP